MRECDKRNSHKSSELHTICVFWITIDTLLLRPSLQFTTLHYPLIWPNPIQISYRTISRHTTTLHPTSLRCTFRWFSPYFYSFHFTPFIIAFLTFFLKVLDSLDFRFLYHNCCVCYMKSVVWGRLYEKCHVASLQQDCCVGNLSV